MNIFKVIKEDIRTVKERDPAAQNVFVIWLTYPGLHARWSHVVEHWLWNRGLKSLARISSQFTRFMTGTEIHPAAVIGRRFFIDHAMGVIIGETTVIGDDVTLYQGVTLGGTGNEIGKRHPTLGNKVLVGVGASILGNIAIGENSKVGAGAVVVDDVPPNCTVIGIPGRIIARDGLRVEDELLHAQAHRESLPDPTAEDIHELDLRIGELECINKCAEVMKRLDERVEEVERLYGRLEELEVKNNVKGESNP
ncbi:MAG: serine O-acetyltransferase [Eggerthellaceae bacterium]|jgi:serine O-acetyltransferase|nr:serine O-acetyltransferase [Eggerthellaceae bacterium]MDR2721316.1 serine O-acetyltransferase [Coriobacteriaceae bacterium]